MLKFVGELNYTWTNTESLLVHVIAGLAGVDKETATVIFLTLSNSRSRIALVERLAKLERTSADRRKAILEATGLLTRCQKLRNHYNHCLYAFDEHHLPTKTINLRIVETKDSLRLDGSRDIDHRTFAEFETSLADMRKANERLWSIIKEYGFPL
ncbi:hypothetical protein DYI37_00445 [Fulvimarina endophytica]|uniref:Uncharacterized protein n=2 Tax=Fulvimarina endophytica TaxID=2293836 RepID=A0A371XB94_9HYPH|nr:hypothetical protein DYI37_00445 [Fulvimarina endophytica]